MFIYIKDDDDEGNVNVNNNNIKLILIQIPLFALLLSNILFDFQMFHIYVTHVCINTKETANFNMYI